MDGSLESVLDEHLLLLPPDSRITSKLDADGCNQPEAIDPQRCHHLITVGTAAAEGWAPLAPKIRIPVGTQAPSCDEAIGLISDR